MLCPPGCTCFVSPSHPYRFYLTVIGFAIGFAILTRDAPEGEEAWASFEDIANEAMASVGGMESVEYLPP